VRTHAAPDPKVSHDQEHPLAELLGNWSDDTLAQVRGIRLADFECRHGKLPGDAGEPCGCWS
jgi:hypothetical protein